MEQTFADQKSWEEMSNKEQSDLLQKAKEEERDEGIAKRTLQRLYNFQPSEYGGYSRIANIFFDEFHRFKAIDLHTRQPIKDKDGEPLYVHQTSEENGRSTLKPKTLEPLEFFILTHLLRIYLREATRYISISKKVVAKSIGKSYPAVRNSFAKLEKLGYIIKLPDRKAVVGGSVRQFDVSPFMGELLRNSQARKREQIIESNALQEDVF